MITVFDDELAHFAKAAYECWCNDECKDGRKHIHQLVYFKNAISWNTIKKAYATSHIEIANNVFDCIKYISDTTKRKTDFQELGTRPVNTRFKSTKELMDETNVENVPWNQINTWKKLKSDKANVLTVDDWKKDVKVYYIQGPSGIGKTEKAKDIIRSLPVQKFNVIKYENGFYGGVSEEDVPIAVYDDFRDSHMKASEFIHLIDYNKHTLNIKGGAKMNNYQTIIITSVQRAEDIYKNMSDEEPRKQWLRRMEIINMYPDKGDLVSELYS